MLRSILILPDLEIPLKSQKIMKKRIYKKIDFLHIRFFLFFFFPFERYFKVQEYQNRTQHEKIPPGSYP